jgi:hypothetical protein
MSLIITDVSVTVMVDNMGVLVIPHQKSRRKIGNINLEDYNQILKEMRI